ncbi:MAG TPA: N-acetyltransferase [bacterium]|nr:N-acetyltransferase [bacterium]
MSSENVQIFNVQSKKDWKQFVMFPYHLYRHHPFWVPPLISDQKKLLDFDLNPFFSHASGRFFLARRGNIIVGRIAALVDDLHNQIHHEKTGFFGFLAVENDYEAAAALLDAARNWVRKQGMKQFRGPVNPSQNEDCGLLIDAFDSPPVIMMPYNPEYLVHFLDQYGLKKAVDLYAYLLDGTKPQPPKLVRVAELVAKKPGVNIRPIDMKHFFQEARMIWKVYNSAWANNYGFVPMTEEEFVNLAKHLKQVVVPDLALMAEIHGKPAGFSLSIPDMNQALIHLNGRLFPLGIFKLLHYSRKINQLRIIILGVLPEYRRTGVDAALYGHTWKNAVSRGYIKGEMSWILENNTMMNRSARMLGGKIYKTYRIYEMQS